MSDTSMFPTRDDLVAQLRSDVEVLARNGGTSCPVCDRHCQEYRRQINKGMVRGLLGMYRAGGTHRDVHLPSEVGRTSAEEAKLQWWGLVLPGASLTPGYWRVTPKGHGFLAGTVTVPKYAVVYNGNLLRLEGDHVRVHDAYRAAFNLQELLST